MARGKTRPAASGVVEGPWVLPEGWRWERLGSYVSDGGASVTPSESPDADFQLFSVPSFLTGKPEILKGSAIGSSKQAVHPDDVLLCKINPRINRVWRVRDARIGRMIASTEWIRFATHRDVEPDFLRYYLMRDEVRNFLAMNVSGVGGSLMRVRPATVEPIAFPLPPIKTQQRIVAHIDELLIDTDDGEAALARARSDLATWRKALLKAAVTGELTAKWRAANPPTETGAELLARILADRRVRWLAEPRNKGKRYIEPAEPNATDLPDLPPGWTWASLGQLASERERSFQSGPFGSSLLHSEFQETGKLVIGIDNVKNGTFSTGSNHRISEEKFKQLERFRARPGDVLITVMATIGRICTIPDDLEDAIITKHVYRISLASDGAIAHFVMNALRSNPITTLYLFGSVQGQTRPGLNKDILETTPIAIGPRAEQAEALRYLNEITSPADNLLDDLDTAAAATLRQSILAAAFRGELVA